MEYIYDDGGRKNAGYKGTTGDCVTRAIAITTNTPYQEVYNTLFTGIKEYGASHYDKTAKRIQRGNGRKGTTPRNGVSKKVYEAYLTKLGWHWIATMHIGEGCHTHLRANELPSGRIIARVSKHLTTVIDGVIHDTFDPSRNETRCVYGYYTK
jgi:hypothetical protein